MKTKNTLPIITETVKSKGMFYNKADLERDLKRVAAAATIDKNKQIDDLRDKLNEVTANFKNANYKLIAAYDKAKKREIEVEQEKESLVNATISKVAEHVSVKKTDFTSVKNGEKCNTCGHITRVYKRSISSAMATSLINLHKLCEGNSDYFHIKKFMETNDFSKFVFWGMIEEMPKNKNIKTKKTSGSWRITAAGKQFVENNKKATEYIHLKDNKLIERSGKKIGIKDCLNEEFNYEQLMKSI